MADTKFTPAPWKVMDAKSVANDTRGLFIEALGTDICDLYMKQNDHSLIQYENAQANANLISAAPDMYEAIARFLPDNINLDNSNISSTNIVPLDIPYGELRNLYRALKKARGE